jgi:hypothetical protein
MPTPNDDDATDERRSTTDARPISRRRMLTGTLAAGALALGGTAGSVAGDQETGRFNDSPGRGGEAVLAEGDFRDQPFEITRRSGDTADQSSEDAISGVTFNCNNGEGNSIFLVAWYFQYTDEDAERVLYTRSNNIDTDRTFRWGGGSKLCEDSVSVPGSDESLDFVQTPYQAVGNQR